MPAGRATAYSSGNKTAIERDISSGCSGNHRHRGRIEPQRLVENGLEVWQLAAGLGVVNVSVLSTVLNHSQLSLGQLRGQQS